MFSGMFKSLINIKYLKYVLAVLVLGCTFFVGRCTAPTKTITNTVTITEKVAANSVQNQEVKTQIQYVDRPVDRVITKTIIREVDGKVTETTTDATHTGNTVINSSQDLKAQVKTEIKTEYVYKDKLVEKLVYKDALKRWDIGVGVGYKLTGESVNIIPTLPKRMVVEANVDYNLTNWMSVGAWANSETVVGAKVGVKF